MTLTVCVNKTLSVRSQSVAFYRPHPKDGGRKCFQSVHRGDGIPQGTYPLSRPGTGGYPKVPTPRPRYLPSLSRSGLGGTPGYLPSLSRSGWGGYPKIPTPDQGTYPPVQVRMRGVPQGTYPQQGTYPPCPGQDGGGVPQGTYPSTRLPPPPGERTAEGVLDMLRLVCLLR